LRKPKPRRRQRQARRVNQWRGAGNNHLLSLKCLYVFWNIIWTIVQPIDYGAEILLYNPRTMGRLYPQLCCTTYTLWVSCTLSDIVRSMIHGRCMHQILLYNPWVMGWVYHCTAHGPWGKYTIVQPMGHGVNILLYNTWSMRFKYHCTTHEPWYVCTNTIIVQCMGHGWRRCCTMHEPWGKYTVVQPMGYGAGIPLYNPWAMGLNTIVQPMDHGV
jgi:hypothetical protein